MKALRITRHCMVCSKTYGCKDENETRECKNCNSYSYYCGSDWQDVTTGICNECFKNKDVVIRHLQ